MRYLVTRLVSLEARVWAQVDVREVRHGKGENSHHRLGIILNIRTSGQSLAIFKQNSSVFDIAQNVKGKYIRVVICGMRILKLTRELSLFSLLRIYGVKVRVILWS
jgi:hypothetical protein